MPNFTFLLKYMNNQEIAVAQYLKNTHFINSDAPEVIDYAHAIVDQQRSLKEQAIQLFYHIRDAFRYNPYHISTKMRATDILDREEAHCVDKACVLAACGRALGIPSRMGFGSVRNHIGTSRLEEILGTNVLAFHGYTEFFLEGKWVKATPAFNKGLCDKLNVEALDFDGENDCLFQQYDKQDGQFMEYINDYGQFDDIPFDLFVRTMKEHYPHLFEQVSKTKNGNFEMGELKVSI